MRKPETRWPDAHIRLKKLYDQRVLDMSQEEFGKRFGIGTGPMVWQLLHGYRPLSFDSAAKFARGLKCTIQDISPEMAQELKKEIIPFLGGRAAAILLSALLAFQYHDAHAQSGPHNAISVHFVKLAFSNVTSAALRLYFSILSILQGFIGLSEQKPLG